MPEGHTLHRIARDHTKWFVGQHMAAYSPQGRFAAEATKLSGKKLVGVEAYGKHLFYRWHEGSLIHVHLGLYGKFRVFKNPPPEPRGAVRLRLIGTERAFDLNGPNRCALATQEDYDGVLQRLGPDPLREDADPELAWQKISHSRTAIGSLLLNQTVIAGIGNVYRAEILFILGIHPERPGHDIDRATFDRIWKLAVELLRIGVQHNRIITVDRETAGKALSRLNGSERLWVYKRPTCARCDSDIYYWELGARSIYACEKCQL